MHRGLGRLKRWGGKKYAKEHATCLQVGGKGVYCFAEKPILCISGWILGVCPAKKEECLD